MSLDNATMTQWKAVWLKVNRQYKGLRADLWEITTLLNEIFDDAEFRAENNLRDDFAAAEWFDSRLPELPVDFMDLRKIMESYPAKNDWRDQKLSVMLEAIRTGIRPVERAKPPKKRASFGTRGSW